MSYTGQTSLREHTLYILCVRVCCRAAEPRSRAGEGGRPVAVGRFSHHVWWWTSVWGKDRHKSSLFISKHTKSGLKRSVSCFCVSRWAALLDKLNIFLLLTNILVYVHLISLYFCVCQVINGLLDRPDWEEAIRTPLGILPGGSGNALAASVHHYSGWDKCRILTKTNHWRAVLISLTVVVTHFKNGLLTWHLHSGVSRTAVHTGLSEDWYFDNQIIVSVILLSKNCFLVPTF